MRIGIVSPYSLTVPGGVQQQVLGLARSLRAKGHEVRVLGPCDGPPPDAFVTPLGNSLPTAVNGSIAPLAPDASAALRTIRALNDEAFDVVHVHEPLVPGPSLTALLVKMAPVVATFHSAGESAAYRTFSRQLKWVASRIDIRVAVSKDAVELAQRYIGGDYEVLFNGIELGDYLTPSTTPRENAIFFIGRHEERKGLSNLLEALAKLPPDVRLWIASDGPQTAELKMRFASDQRIEWLGRISDSEKISRMGLASVFCAPSLHGESFGVVLLEAMAAGTPVVASNLDGYRNVATDDETALLVETGNVASLASALARVLDDSQLAARLTANGREHAQRFSMDTLADRYIEMYERALHMEATNITTIKVPRMLKRFEGRFLRRSHLGDGR
ncbi:MAG: phosphatidylinositol alpha-mannosyltransferase [Acidimicrobium sp.]|nr:MAG: phosphatidylinositol alpha-mannosyltransferase [Acidimicrobium sp.]